MVQGKLRFKWLSTWNITFLFWSNPFSHFLHSHLSSGPFFSMWARIYLLSFSPLMTSTRFTSLLLSPSCALLMFEFMPWALVSLLALHSGLDLDKLGSASVFANLALWKAGLFTDRLLFTDDVFTAKMMAQLIHMYNTYTIWYNLCHCAGSSFSSRNLTTRSHFH